MPDRKLIIALRRARGGCVDPGKSRIDAIEYQIECRPIHRPQIMQNRAAA